MRIIIHDYAGHPFQVDLSRELARRGHDVVHAFAGGLLTPRGALQRRADDPVGLTFSELPMHPDYRRRKYSFVRRRNYEAAYGKILAEAIREIRPDVVLSGNTPTEPQCLAQRTCQKLGIRFVNWVQDIYGVAVDKLVRKKIPVVGTLIGRYYLSLDRRCLRESDHIVVISPDFEDFLSTWGLNRERISVIPNWAALESIPVQSKHNPWSISHGLHQKFAFVYSGTLAMKHNPDLLLQLAKAFASHPEVAVVVISEGPGSDWLAKAKSIHQLDNLILLPFQPFEKLPQVLGSADVLLAVLEADAGAFSVPSKVLSYLCAARPLLTAMPATNLAARLITSIPAGIAVAPDEPARFVSYAQQLRADAKNRLAFATAARQYAEANFQIAKVASKFETLLTGA